jgi:hypothetical protein
MPLSCSASILSSCDEKQEQDINKRRRTNMKRMLIVVVLIGVCSAPLRAGAVTEEDFKARTTQAIVDLCTVSPDDPAYSAALHFCHGYLLGAFHYHMAESAGDESKRMVCFPNPGPSRNEAVKMFLNWAQSHQEYMNEFPVETEFRFLVETWPCKK